MNGDGKEETRSKRGGGKGDKGGGGASEAPKPAPIKIMKRVENVPTQPPPV